MIFVLTKRYIVIQFTPVDEQYRSRVANDEANPLNWITIQQEVRDRRYLKPGIGPGFSFSAHAPIQFATSTLRVASECSSHHIDGYGQYVGCIEERNRPMRIQDLSLAHQTPEM
jgi:hypothetical protein